MILDAAEAIVLEQGFAALNARKIAMKVGYTVGSIYMVFANMADLALHVKARTLDDLSAQLLQVPDKDAPQVIEALATTYLRYASQNYNRWRMIFDHHPECPPDSFEWYRQKVDHVFQIVESPFTKLGVPCADAEKKRAARTLWAGVHGVCTLALSGSLDVAGVDDVEASVILLVRSFIQGWVCQFQTNSYAQIL